MTSPIQGSARVRVEADTSRLVPDVLAAVRQAVDAAQQAIAEGLTFTVDMTPLDEAVAEATGAVTGLADEAADVVLSADATPLETEVAQAAGSIGQLPDAAAAAAAGIRAALSGVFDGLTAAASAVGSTIATGLQAGAAAAAALGAATIGAGIAFNSLSQSVSQGLTAVLGTRDAARDLIDEVIELNQTAAFSRQAFLASTQQLVGFGVEAEQVTDVLDAMQQAVVAVGGGEAEFAQLTDILAQVESQGRATGETVQRLGALGINLAQLIADTTGESVEAVQEAISAGEIGLDEITDALNTRYSGAVEGYANTWAGAQGMVLAAIRNIGSGLVEAFIGLESGGAAVEGLNAIADGLFHVQSVVLPGLLPLVEQLADRFVTVAEAVGGFLESIPEDALTGALSGIASTLDGLGPLIGALAAGLGVAFAGSLPVIGQFVAGLNPIVVAIATLVAATPELRDAFVDVFTQIFDAVAPLLPILADVARTLLDALVPVVASLAGALGDVVAELAPVIAALLQGLTPILAPLSDLLLQVADIIGDLLVGAIADSGPIMTEFAEAVIQVVSAVLPLVPALLPLLPLVADLSGLFVALLAPLTPLVQILGDLLSTTIPPLAAVIELLAGILSNNLGVALDLISGLFEGLGGNLDSAAGLFSELVLPAFEAFTAFLNETVIPAVEGLVGGFVENLLPALSTLVSFVGDALVPRLTEFGIMVQENLLPPLQQLATVLRDQVGGAVAAVSNLWTEALQPAWQQLVALWNEELQPSLQQLADLFRGQLLPLLQSLWELVDGPVITALGALAVILGGAVLGAIFGSIQAFRIFVGAVTNAVNVIGGVVRIASSLAGVLSGPLRAAISVVRTGINLFSSALSNVISNISAVIGWLQTLIDTASNALSALGNIPGAGAIGGFFGFGAQGAIIDHPTMMVMGEGHRREVLIPLEQGAGRAWQLAKQSGLVDLLASALGPGIWPEKPMPEIVTALSGPSAAGLGRAARGGDPELLAEVQGMREEMRAMRTQLGSARPVTIPVTQVPGEDGEALARRVERRITLAAGV